MRSLVSLPSSIRPLFLALALAGLSACSTAAAPPKAEAPATASTASTEAPAALPHIAMGCLEANAEWTLGKQVDDTLIAKAKADAEAAFVRVIKPGQAVTMEYNGARLNLHANGKGMVERVSCG